MEKETAKVLKRWEVSLERYGKLDQWKYSHDLSVLGSYVRYSEDDKTTRKMVGQIRDKAICSLFVADSVLPLIRKTLCEENGSPSVCKEQRRSPKNGQDARFRDETRRIFGEKLRFKDGMLLRNFDVETESAYDSKKVRRIVEKRMCQAYHRMHKRTCSSTKDRYWKHRATAFQLYNIGQVENVRNVSRGESTHWKRVYDSLTGSVVFKKKMSYSSEQEALTAIELWKIEHPSDLRPLQAYQCTHCHKWHIGHDNYVKVETDTDNLFVF